MQKRKMAIVLFCLVSSLIFSSCVKKTLGTASTPIIAAAKVVSTCARAIFNTFNLNHGHHSHTHKKKICDDPPVDDVPESK